MEAGALGLGIVERRNRKTGAVKGLNLLPFCLV